MNEWNLLLSYRELYIFGALNIIRRRVIVGVAILTDLFRL